MGLEEIIGRIDADARAVAEAIREEGRRQAGKQLEMWASRGRDEAEAIRRRTREELERQKRQATAEVKLTSSKAILGRKRDLLKRVTGEAWRHLMEEEPAVHREVLAALLDQHLAGSDEVIFSADPLGREAAALAGKGGKATRPRLETAAPDCPPRGGVIIRKGPVSFDFSFDRLLEDLASRYQVEIQKMLFGGGRA